ncbi:hypothetical protein [Streptomyces sp. NPDC088400]|uniref:hypothetical protein n=1 Tax=Streptomyces sp. NPDC088400 TaxID=3365861 RepID=UPI0037F9DDFB|nr:hypothetical protein OH820_07650 [Streptomyces sp. NBC_00857]
MAKNKNRDRGGKQHNRPAAEHESEQSKSSSSSQDASTEEKLSHITPSDVAQKGRQKRFGHN